MLREVTRGDRTQKSDASDLLWLLGARGERPGHYTKKNSEELSPSNLMESHPTPPESHRSKHVSFDHFVGAREHRRRHL